MMTNHPLKTPCFLILIIRPPSEDIPESEPSAPPVEPCRRIATRSLGSLSALGGGAAGSMFIDRGISLPFGWTHVTPFAFALFTLLLIASFRPVGPPAFARCQRKVPGSFWVANRARVTWPLWCQGRYRDGTQKVPGTFRCLIWPLMRLWYAWCSLLQETTRCLPQRRALKLASLYLVALFAFQYPLLAMADHRGVPEEVRSDLDFFIYHHGDHLGSAHVMTEGKEESRHSGVVYRRGQIVQRFEYSPFGQETFSLNPNLKFDPSYTGQIYDIESGLYYYKSRYYNPQLGRFIQPDTVVPDAKNLQAYNRYTYVNNNPLKYVDPTGHFLGIVGFFVAVAIGALLGGAMAAAFGGNIWMGMLTGAITGAAFFGAGQAIQAINAARMLAGQAAISLGAQVSIHAAAGAVAGVINNTVVGGGVDNLGKAALVGAISGGAGKLTGGLLDDERFFPQLFSRTGTGAATGATAAALMGGDPLTGAWQGAAMAAAGTVFNDLFHRALKPSMNAEPLGVLESESIDLAGEESSGGPLLAQNSTAGAIVKGVDAVQKYANQLGDINLYGQVSRALQNFSATIPAGQSVEVNVYFNPTTKQVLGVYPVSQPVLTAPSTVQIRIPFPIVGTGS